jgi:hypothetical protein
MQESLHPDYQASGSVPFQTAGSALWAATTLSFGGIKSLANHIQITPCGAQNRGSSSCAQDEYRSVTNAAAGCHYEALPERRLEGDVT